MVNRKSPSPRASCQPGRRALLSILALPVLLIALGFAASPAGAAPPHNGTFHPGPKLTTLTYPGKNVSVAPFVLSTPDRVPWAYCGSFGGFSPESLNDAGQKPIYNTVSGNQVPSVAWVLAYSYPGIQDPTTVSTLSGVPNLTNKDVFIAAQAAIWHLKEGASATPVSGFTPSQLELYDWYVSHAGTAPSAPISISFPVASPHAGDRRLGPFTVTAPGGAALASSSGQVVDGKGKSIKRVPAGTTQVWLSVPAGAVAGQTYTITADGPSAAGYVQMDSSDKPKDGAGTYQTMLNALAGSPVPATVVAIAPTTPTPSPSSTPTPTPSPSSTSIPAPALPRTGAGPVQPSFDGTLALLAVPVLPLISVSTVLLVWRRRAQLTA